MKDVRIKIGAYLQVVLLIYALLITMPYLIRPITGGLDLSYVVGLHKAHIQELTHGREVVFTYGPLGFLIFPIIITRNAWMYSAGYTLAVYLLALCAFCVFVRKTRANPLNSIIFTLIFVTAFKTQFSGTDYGIPLSVFICIYLYLQGKRSIPLLIGLAFICSITAYIKFSIFMMICTMAVVLLYVLIAEKRRLELAWFAGTALVSFLVAGCLIIGEPKAIIDYYRAGVELSTGYSDGMSLSGENIQVIYAVGGWIFFIGLILYNAFRKKRSDLIFLILSFGMLFVSFKHGFVRHDLHVIYYISTWMLVFGLYYLKVFHQRRRYSYLILLFTMSLFCQSLIITQPFKKLFLFDELPGKIATNKNALKVVTSKNVNQHKRDAANNLSDHYTLTDETLQLLKGYTVDVFNWDLAITELYGLNWWPRPVFQSYTAYTAYLDRLNQAHFRSNTAPDYVLFRFISIDGRYPLFDEPATFRTLLTGYKPCTRDGEFLVLRKKESVDRYEKRYIRTTVARFGQIIEVPRIDNGLLFGRVRIEPNLLGKILKLLFKPPKVYLRFFKDGRKIKTHRFIFPNATDGIFLSQYVFGPDDLHHLWQGNIKQNITGISFRTRRPGFFKRKITVDFFEIRAHTE